MFCLSGFYMYICIYIKITSSLIYGEDTGIDRLVSKIVSMYCDVNKQLKQQMQTIKWQYL
jgi:hypothetical protein